MKCISCGGKKVAAKAYYSHMASHDALRIGKSKGYQIATKNIVKAEDKRTLLTHRAKPS